MVIGNIRNELRADCRALNHALGVAMDRLVSFARTDEEIVLYGDPLSPAPQGVIHASERDQTDLGASDDRPLGPDYPLYWSGS